MSGEDVLKMITDRTQKVKTNEWFVPSGKFGSIEGLLKEYTTLRDDHIECVKTMKDDLRDHYQKFEFGTVDEYQVILFHGRLHFPVLIWSHPVFLFKTSDEMTLI